MLLVVLNSLVRVDALLFHFCLCEKLESFRPSWVQRKLTARRNFGDPLTVLWHELLQISSSLSLADRDDIIALKMHYSGIYGVQSLYACSKKFQVGLSSTYLLVPN